MKLDCDRMTATLTRGSSLYGRLCMARYEHPVLFFAVCVLFAATALLLFAALANPAIANETEDKIAGMAPWDWADELIKNAFSLININTDFLKQSFDAVLGKDTGAYSFIKDVNNNVMKPISASILGIVFLVEVVKLANDFESRGALPPFKNIVFLWICVAICLFILNKSLDFAQDIFNMFNALIDSTMNIGTNNTQFFTGGTNAGDWTFTYKDEYNNEITVTQNMLEGLNPVGFLGKLLLGLVLYVECIIVSVVTYFSLLARGFQVYVYAAVSPMMLAFLGSEKTQQWGINFIKSFIALCLAGLIMAICIKVMPLAAAGVAKAAGGGIGGFFMIVATLGVYIKAMASAGSWAKEIMGG